MQIYDVLMLAVLGGSILFGLWKGFAWQIASLASITISYLVARNFSALVADRIGGDPAWNKFLAMFILFFGCSFAIWIVFGLVRSTIDRMYLKSFDRQVGAAVGALQGAVLCILVTLFSVSLLGEGVCRAVCTSLSGNYVAQALGRLHGVVPDEIRQYVGPYVDKFNSEMQEHRNDVPAGNGLGNPLDLNWPAGSGTGNQPSGWTPPGDMTWSGNIEPAAHRPATLHGMASCNESTGAAPAMP